MSASVVKPIDTTNIIRSNSPEALDEYVPTTNTPQLYNSKSIPIKKSTRFGSFFSSNNFRSNSKLSSSITTADPSPPTSAHPLPSNSTPSITNGSALRRRSNSSGAQSYLSVDNNVDSPRHQQQQQQQHKLSRSIGNLIASPASWTRKHLHHHYPHHHHSSSSESSSPSTYVPKLSEKYGDYIKPSKSASTKASGATNKHNIGSGATAVIRLVRMHSTGRILAVKEFIKKDKNEDEKEYLKRMHNEYCISKTVSGHANVVETMDLVLDEHDRWCTVMEYVSCCNSVYVFM